MAIEKLKRTWFLLERGELDRFVRRLADLKAAHVIDLKEAWQPGPGRPEEGGQPLPHAQPPPADQAAVEDNVHKLTRILDVLDAFAPRKRSFAETFVTVPMEMTRSEFDRAVGEIDVEDLCSKLTLANHEHANAAKRIGQLEALLAQLRLWVGASAPPASLSRCRADLGTIPSAGLAAFLEAAEKLELLAAEPLMSRDGKTLLALAWLKESDRAVAELLGAQRFEALGLSEGEGPIGEIIRELETDIAADQAQMAYAALEIARFAPKRRAVVAALAHWESELERCRVAGKTLVSKRIVTIVGYVRVREMKRLEGWLAREFPGVSLVAEDPVPGQKIPVSLGQTRLFGPAQFLTTMFGLPDYWGFDPSPYIFFTVLLFFGMCFGDVIYGLMLLGLGLWLAHKAGENRGLARLFTLLAIGGAVSVAVGVVTGSWAGDLLSEKWLGKGNFMGVWTNRLTLLDPIKKPVLGLGIVLGLGVLNQFYAIILLAYREWRKGERLGALCDGGLWLIFLPGLLLVLMSLITPLPPAVRRVGLTLVGVGAVGLVLTQGRREPTFLGKAITGVVSLYGIVGSYGATSFIGDTLSYSRLLALGLTTAIVAQSCHMIAALIPQILNKMLGMMVGITLPFAAGVVLTVVAAIVFHILNLLISALGAFVHSARLIFVEFFSRFYEGGAQPFVPLGTPQSVRVVDNQ